MTSCNMVENNTNLLEDASILVKGESAVLFADKLFDSILRMEYMWEFRKLESDQQKISWAISHSEWRIVLWHDRRGQKEETYENWKTALTTRFFRRITEMKKFLDLIILPNQKLSNFIIEVETKGKRLQISPEMRMAFLKSKIKCENVLGCQILLEENLITENLIARVEDAEQLQRNDDFENSPNKAFCNLALRCARNERPEVKIEINGRRVKALCDTGSDLNLLNVSMIGDLPVYPAKITIFSANDEELSVIGKTTINTYPSFIPS